MHVMLCRSKRHQQMPINIINIAIKTFNNVIKYRQHSNLLILASLFGLLVILHIFKDGSLGFRLEFPCTSTYTWQQSEYSPPGCTALVVVTLVLKSVFWSILRARLGCYTAGIAALSSKVLSLLLHEIFPPHLVFRVLQLHCLRRRSLSWQEPCNTCRIQ